jgi:hypothetical protein
VEGNAENSMPQYEDGNPDLDDDEYDQEQNPDEIIRDMLLMGS